MGPGASGVSKAGELLHAGARDDSRATTRDCGDTAGAGVAGSGDGCASVFVLVSLAARGNGERDDAGGAGRFDSYLLGVLPQRLSVVARKAGQQGRGRSVALACAGNALG